MLETVSGVRALGRGSDTAGEEGGNDDAVEAEDTRSDVGVRMDVSPKVDSGREGSLLRLIVSSSDGSSSLS